LNAVHNDDLGLRGKQHKDRANIQIHKRDRFLDGWRQSEQLNGMRRGWCSHLDKGAGVGRQQGGREAKFFLDAKYEVLFDIEGPDAC